MSNLTTKRFVIRKSLIGKNTVITFVNKKNETVKYNHDEVYTTHKERFVYLILLFLFRRVTFVVAQYFQSCSQSFVVMLIFLSPRDLRCVNIFLG